MTRFTILLVFALLSGAARAAEPAAAEPSKAGLEQAFGAIRSAVVANQPDALLSWFHARGFECVDEPRDRAEVARQLTGRTGRYHAVFFSSEALQTPPLRDQVSARVSLRELLGAPDLQLHVDANGAAGSVFLKSAKLGRSFSLLLDWIDGRWWISDFDDC